MNILEIKNLWVRYQKYAVVRGVSLAVKPGEFVALIGNSGSGKSTVAQTILRLNEHAVTEGQIFYKRRNLPALDEADLRKIRGSKIAMIFQEPMTSLNPLHTVGKQIAEVFKLHNGTASKKQIIELLKLVELQDFERVYGSFPHELSGGQRQRVMIAMALAGKPDILIADEPTTALDVCVQAQILELLKILQQKLGLAVLFITHDLNIVRKMADRLYVMRSGQIISTHLPPEKTETIRQFTEAQGKPVIDVKALTVQYGSFKAVDKATFQLYQGQTLGIIGESGSGKSSLAYGLMRLIPATGKVLLNGDDFFALKGKALTSARANIQMVMQDPAGSLNPRLTIFEIIEEGLSVHFPKLTKEERAQKVKAILKAVDLRPNILERYPHEISGGQKTRVALARVLILNPRVLVLDEVTASLDINTQKQLVDLLLRLQKRYKLVYIFITHDIKLMRLIADNLLVMKSGRVVEQGPAQALIEHPKQPYTTKLMKAGLLHINLYRVPL